MLTGLTTSLCLPFLGHSAFARFFRCIVNINDSLLPTIYCCSLLQQCRPTAMVSSACPVAYHLTPDSATYLVTDLTAYLKVSARISPTPSKTCCAPFFRPPPYSTDLPAVAVFYMLLFWFLPLWLATRFLLSQY